MKKKLLEFIQSLSFEQLQSFVALSIYFDTHELLFRRLINRLGLAEMGARLEKR